MQAAPCFVFEPFRLDVPDQRLWRGSTVVPVPPKPFALLCCLVARAGRLVTKEALLQAVWPEVVVQEDVITVAIGQLRQILGDRARTPRFIETVHGRGYRFIAPVVAAASSPESLRTAEAQQLPLTTPRIFVGREAALARMQQWWTTVLQGQRQLGLIAGEPGIGKTALVDTFVAQVAATADVWIGQGQCEDMDEGWRLQGGYATITGMVPESLRRLIEQQIEQLSPEEQALLDSASVAGSTFTAAAVTAGVDQCEETIDGRYASWARQGRFVCDQGMETWPDGTVTARYSFRHALYHEVVYRRVATAQRVRLHRQIGLRKEAGYGAQVGVIAAELALHFERGRDARRALTYRYQAADNALQRSGYAEAIAHLTAGLVLLTNLPDTPERAQHELRLQTALGSALIATKGHASPDVERVYARAYALCRQVCDTPQQFKALSGIRLFYLVRGELHTARELGEQLLHLAQDIEDPALLLGAHQALGTTLFEAGELLLAHAHLQQGLMLYDHQSLRVGSACYIWDHGVVCCSYTALTLWCLGYRAQALQRRHKALTLAKEVAHPFSMASAFFWTALLAQCCQDAPVVYECAEALIALATEQGFAQRVASGMVLRGWALAAQGHGAEALTHMLQGMTAYRATGAEWIPLHHLALLAEAYGNVGQTAEGLRVLAEPLANTYKVGERYYEAELHRLKGTLLLRLAVPDATEAERCFLQALTVSRRQQAKSWELRAAMSLAYLWQQQGKRAEAHDLLASIYGWFTEGFDTADLQEAKVLLEDLGT